MRSSPMESRFAPAGEFGWTPGMAASWWACVVLVAMHFSFAYMQHNGMFLNMHDYAAGSAAAPYQQRILMAWFIRLVGHYHTFDHTALNVAPSMRSTAGMCTFVASVVSMVGAVACTAGSLRVMTGNKVFSRWAGFLVCYMAYFPLCLVFGATFIFPYDVPSLFFLTFCLYCTLRDLPWLYLPGFAVATANRETICMATVFFAGWYFFRRVRSTGFLAVHVAVQVALWVGLRMWIQRHYPGVGTEVKTVMARVIYNIHIVRNPLQLPVLLSNFGFLWIVLVGWRRYVRDPFLFFGLAVTGTWLVILFGTGVYNEIRIFTDLASFVALAVGVTVWNRMRAAELVEGVLASEGDGV